MLLLGILVWTGATEASAQDAAVLPAAGGALVPSEIEGLGRSGSSLQEFSRAWLRKTDAVIRRRAELRAAGLLDGASPADMARVGGALTGDLRVPVILVRYADVAAPFAPVSMANRLFGESRGDTVSYAAYWREVSGGLVDVHGMVTSWVRLPNPARHYLRGEDEGWGRFGRVAELRQEALDRADPALDFSTFDNDGPDGIPNSGDDDGFVDFVAFFYATRCGRRSGEGAIWPHRGAMAPYVTDDRAAGGGFIRIADYVILPALSAATCAPSQIGVLAHETAHAFGMPDLYDYDGSSYGIGSWGLMGTGSHSSPHSPAHPGAWVREKLGWVREDRLELDSTGVIQASGGRDRILRVTVPDGSGRYLLLEERTVAGSDRDLPGHGLLVWMVDPERAQAGMWNGDERQPAVALVARDADGILAVVDGEDTAGPFPGLRVPPESERLPLTLDAIGNATETLVRARSIPGLAWSRLAVALTTSVDGPAIETDVDVRADGAAAEWRPRSAATWLHVRRVRGAVRLVADGGHLAPGDHPADVELVESRTGRVADRLSVTMRVAAPGAPAAVAREIDWTWGLAAAGSGVVLGGMAWNAVGLRPRPRLLLLPGDGGFARTLVRLPADALYSPTPAPGGGVYVLARAHDETYLYRADPDGTAALVAARPVDGPAYGLTTLPDGSLLVAEWSGRLTRVSPGGVAAVWLDLRQAVYQVAADRDGRVFAALYSGDIARVDPDGTVTVVRTGVERGRLVAVAAAPGGGVYAAERGGEGRILAVDGDGVRTVARVPGAAFYGLAADRLFVYAADLSHRLLLRFARPQSGPAPRPGGISVPADRAPPTPAAVP